MANLNCYTIVIKPDDNGTYIAYVPAIPGCHAVGRTSAEAQSALEDVFAMIAEEYKEAKEIVFLVEEAPEVGYTAKALGYSIFTQADNWDELRESVRDAVSCHFNEGETPRIIRLHFVRDEVLVA